MEASLGQLAWPTRKFAWGRGTTGMGGIEGPYWATARYIGGYNVVQSVRDAKEIVIDKNISTLLSLRLLLLS
eukprot:SAG31_NODE_35349_length_324_cov_0.688889_1_plen_72_part_00